MIYNPTYTYKFQLKTTMVWLDSWMFCYTWYKSLGARELEDGLRKKNKINAHKTFHILEMKAHFQREPLFENKNLLWNPFWKWKHVFGKVESN